MVRSKVKVPSLMSIKVERDSDSLSDGSPRRLAQRVLYSPRRPGTYLYDTYIVEYYIVFIRIGHTDTDYFTPSEMMKLWFLAHFGGIGRLLGSVITFYKLPFSFLTLLYYQSKARAHLRESIDQDLDSSAQDEVDEKTESLLAEVGWKKNSQTGKWMPPSK